MIEVPTTISGDKLDELRSLIDDHIESTGESVSSLAKRSNVGRELLSKLRGGTYPSSPTFDVVARILEAIGKQVVYVDASD